MEWTIFQASVWQLYFKQSDKLKYSWVLYIVKNYFRKKYLNNSYANDIIDIYINVAGMKILEEKQEVNKGYIK